MKSFPWDSVVTELGEDGYPVYDRMYKAEDLREVNSAFFSNGVFINSNEAHVVKARSDMSVTVGTGKCIIRGTVGYIKDEPEIVTLPAPSSLPRIDTIVLRWDAAISGREIQPHVISGTPSKNPVAPTLTRNVSVYELGLANILVNPSDKAPQQRNISDTRLNTSRCGVAAPLIEINVTSFYEQLDAALDYAIREHEANAKYQMKKLDEEIDRLIYLSDSITGGTGESCGCYAELQQVKQLLYQLLKAAGEERYYVIGKTMFAPKKKFIYSDNKVILKGFTLEGSTLTIDQE